MDSEKIIEALADDLNAKTRHLRKKLFEGVIALHDELFAIPGEEERYQAWLESRRAKEVRA